MLGLSERSSQIFWEISLSELSFPRTLGRNAPFLSCQIFCWEEFLSPLTAPSYGEKQRPLSPSINQREKPAQKLSDEVVLFLYWSCGPFRTREIRNLFHLTRPRRFNMSLMPCPGKVENEENAWIDMSKVMEVMTGCELSLVLVMRNEQYPVCPTSSTF